MTEPNRAKKVPSRVLGDLSVLPSDGQRRLKPTRHPIQPKTKASGVMQQPNQSERVFSAAKGPRKAPEPRKKASGSPA